MSRCKRTLYVEEATLDAAGVARLTIPPATTELLLRVVNSSGVGQAFTVTTPASGGASWHVAAGEAWADERLDLVRDLELIVTGAAADTAELARWEG